MIRFDCDFECQTTQDAIYALQEIIKELEDGYSCGHLCGVDGSWSCEGEEEEEGETRTIRAKLDVASNDMDLEVPVSIENDAIADWIHSKYGWKVEWFEVIEDGEVVYL